MGWFHKLKPKEEEKGIAVPNRSQEASLEQFIALHKAHRSGHQVYTGDYLLLLGELFIRLAERNMERFGTK